ncbi:MAG TPA: ankyrin repeat domain-containing protein [Gemmataceae bacterium]|nr:ankyrin repeat domain-containing protein [Gemmataceae bacterium]
MAELDAEVSVAVYTAFNGRDVAEFCRLLRKHPEFLRHEDGTDRWMWQAAMDGYLPLVECLADLGQDVNEPKDAMDPDDPDCSFCQVEGPIVQAAGEGHLEVVRWLLARGARINFTINGKRRCLPLLDAATKGHLDVVKLLVDNGADIHASFNRHTPLSQAVNYGHPVVAEYLRSVGAVK